MNRNTLHFLKQRLQDNAFNDCTNRLEDLILHYGKVEVLKTFADIKSTSYPDLVWHLKNLVRTYSSPTVLEALASIAQQEKTA